jgi:tetratricopeptide (TPR) repeat protein
MHLSKLLNFLLAPALLLTGCATAEGQAGRPDLRWESQPAPITNEGKAMAHYIAGSYYNSIGRFKEAYDEISQVPKLDPKAITPTLRLIKNHLRKQEYDQALAMAEAAVKQSPENANLLIVLGQIYHQMNRFEEAVSTLAKAIDLNPDNMLGYGALVDLQESTNDLVSAVEIYERLLKLTPDSPVLHYQLGLNLVRINDPERAIVELEKAVELSPQLVRARYMLGTLELERGNAVKAVEHLSSYIRSRPGDPRAAENLVGALARLGRYHEAMGMMGMLLNSPSPEVRHGILAMHLYLVAGKPESVATFEPAQGAPYFGTLYNAWARRANHEPYESKLQSIANIDGDITAEIDTFLNDLLYLFGEEQTSAWLLEKLDDSERIVEGSPQLAFLRSQIYMKTKKYAEARDALLPLLENPAASQKNVHYYLAICFDELDDFLEAESHLKAYLQLNPDDPDVLNFLGYLYAEENVKLDEAAELLQRALAQDPANPYYMDSMGWIYYRQGNAEKAIEYIQNAIYGMDTDDAILRDHLGDAYLLKGDVERARREWERALRLKKDIEGVKEKLDKYRAPAVSASAK